MALMYVVDASVDNAIDQVLTSVAGGVPALADHLNWSGIWSTFFAILAVVTYHDLRVAPGRCRYRADRGGVRMTSRSTVRRRLSITLPRSRKTMFGIADALQTSPGRS